MSVTQSFELRLDFQNYWHTGSGQSSGHHLDALCQKDAAGLPYVSGRQLKGLLRHAVRRAEAWGWYDQVKQTLQLTGSNAVETVLFGSSSQGDSRFDSDPGMAFVGNALETVLFGSNSQDDSRFDSDPGMVFVGNAELPQDERVWLGQPEQTLVRSQLYVDMYNTAINAETGTVVKHSLRGTELAIPVSLFANLSFKPTALDADTFAQQQLVLDKNVSKDLIEPALSLVDLCGAHRSRGLGEVIVSLKNA